MVRILAITSRADEGGGPRQLRDLIYWTQSLGLPVQWTIACPTEGVHSEALRKFAVKIIDLPFRRWSFSAQVELQKSLNEIDLIHSFGRGGGVYSRLLWTSKPILHSPQGLLPQGLNRLHIQIFENLAKIRTTEYVVNSNSEIHFLRRSLGDVKSQILPPMITPDFFLKRQTPSRQDQNSLRLAVSICRLDPHKNLPFLIKNLLPFRDRIKLMIYGDGPQKGELETLLRSHNWTHVVLAGSTDKAKEALESSDLFLSASISESFGISVAEAMAVGIPCIVSRVPGHTDLIGQDERGILFDLNENSFKEKLEYALLNPGTCQQRAQSARHWISSHFEAQNVVEHLMEIYGEAARS